MTPENKRVYNLVSLKWEDQHKGVSCEQFQLWKRENDPEYQRQGLAGYLRDNGISEFLFDLPQKPLRPVLMLS